MEATTVTAALAALGGLAVAAGLLRPALARARVARRLAAASGGGRDGAAPDAGQAAASGTSLARRLALAGYRSNTAVRDFALATALLALAGAASGWLLASSAALGAAERAAAEAPSAIGGLVLPLLGGLPWLIALALPLLPFLAVRGRRRRIVREVEEDLPQSLDLLAALAEAGLGFDAALDRVLGSTDEQRPLAQSLRTFQREALGGVARATCFRRLAARLEVPGLTSFASALVQAERLGIGLAEVLGTQANDLRSRRRERALMRAKALPVKLVFPLVICFLPAVFVMTLGSAFYAFFRLAERVTEDIRR